MSSYIEETLVRGETVLLEAKIALRKYWLNYILGLPYLMIVLLSPFIGSTSEERQGAMIMAVTGVVMAALFLFVPVMRYLTNELALTNKRVIAKVGIISLTAVEIKLEKIESVIVRQGIFGKLLNYGTIVIAGTGGTHAVFPAIVEPVGFKRQFNSLLEPAHSQTGVTV